MIIRLKLLKKTIFLIILLGVVFPIKAPVSSAKAKLCCMNKGVCMMNKDSGAQISVMGSSKSSKMIACCEDNCLACSDTSVLHTATKLASQNIGLFSMPAALDFISVNKFLFNTGPPSLRRPEFRLIFGIHTPPIFQLNSIFLI
jgi:hypothetical protein